MKHIISYSGGACSFWAAHRVIQKHGPENVVLLFADTKIEDPDLYEFNRRAEVFLGVPITVIADGRTPWEVFFDNRMMGNTRADICSRVLKRDLLWKWIKDNCDPADTTVYLGMDWTEEHRLVKVRAKRSPWRIEAPMMDGPIWDKDRMISELKKIGIPIPRLYGLGFPHNNCGGFCIKAGQAHFKHLLNKLPDTFAFHRDQEQLFREKVGKNVAILRDRRNKKTTPLTLADLEKRVMAGAEIDEDEWGGCGCSH